MHPSWEGPRSAKVICLPEREGLLAGRKRASCLWALASGVHLTAGEVAGVFKRQGPVAGAELSFLSLDTCSRAQFWAAILMSPLSLSNPRC